MKNYILTDITKCIGCKACALACKEINQLSKDVSPDELSAHTWTIVDRKKGYNVRRQCMHCEDPACASACPVGAFTKTETGAVIYDEDKCMGCRYCMVACPFGIPKYEWEKALPRVQKCILCYEKALKKGEQPACTKACPTGATIFGDKNSIIKEAYSRLEKYPDRYVNNIYGLKEAGGTSVLYLSPVPMSELGFPAEMQGDSYPKLTWNVLSKIPNVVSVAGVALFGTWWIINRRMKLADTENDEN